MVIAYSIILAISLLLPAAHYLLIKKQQRIAWLFVLYLCVCMVNLGYLLLSVSKTVEFALFANKLAYFGQVFVLLSMLMLMMRICNFSYAGWLPIVLAAIALVMLVIIFSSGHTDWYYTSVKLVSADGASKLEKEYGILHPVYLIYVLAYFVAMLTVIIISIRKGRAEQLKLVGLMLVIVLGNIGMWLVEKLVTWNFEFLSVSYLMSELVFFFAFWLLDDYEKLKRDNLAEPQISSVPQQSLTLSEKMSVVMSRLPEGVTLSQRQKQVLEGILNNKTRKEIASDMYLSENTVKMYISSLYRALGVSSREEIFLMCQ